MSSTGTAFHLTSTWPLVKKALARLRFPESEGSSCGNPRTRSPHYIHVGSCVLLIVGIVALGFYGAIRFEAWACQSYESWRLDRIMNRQSESGATPGARLSEGTMVGRVEVPRIGLTAMVLEGVDEGILRKAVGHVPSTASPGKSGNVVIAGHRDTFFRPLKGIRKDDRIDFITPEGSFGYRVDSIELVSPTDVRVTRPTAHRTLTLLTCYPFEYIGAAPKRFVVRAEEIDSSPVPHSNVLLPKANPVKSTPAKKPPALPSAPLAASVAQPGRGEDLPAAASAAAPVTTNAGTATVGVASVGQYHIDAVETGEAQAPRDTTSNHHGVFGKIRSWMGSLPRRFANQ